MKRFVMLLPLVAAACNSGPSVTASNASVEEVSNKVAAAQASGDMLISPGHWDGKVVITNLDMPGMDKMPPEMAKAMKAKMMQGQSYSTCVTAEDVKSPRGGMFGGDKSCRYEHFTMSGGTIDAAMTCNAAGQKRSSTMKGSYTADSYHLESTSTGAGPIGTMTMTIDAKRAGACTGKEAG